MLTKLGKNMIHNAVTFGINDNFDSFIDSHHLVVVDFYATWCGHCKKISPIIDAWAHSHEDIEFLKVDIDKFHDLAVEYGVKSMPTFFFFVDGKIVDKVIGANRDKIEDIINNKE